jgi:hypothetical protein
MNPGDLMMLGEEAILYEPDPDDSARPGREVAGSLGEVVVVISQSNIGIVRVLHPVYGLRDVYDFELHPMTGGVINEAR